MSKGGATLRRFCYLRVTVWGCGAQQTAALEVVATEAAPEVVAAGALAVVVAPFITSASARTV